jgi:hypothetical protein
MLTNSPLQVVVLLVFIFDRIELVVLTVVSSRINACDKPDNYETLRKEFDSQVRLLLAAHAVLKLIVYRKVSPYIPMDTWFQGLAITLFTV